MLLPVLYFTADHNPQNEQICVRDGVRSEMVSRITNANHKSLTDALQQACIIRQRRCAAVDQVYSVQMIT